MGGWEGPGNSIKLHRLTVVSEVLSILESTLTLPEAVDGGTVDSEADVGG